MQKKQKKVMVFGTYDIVHPGHLNFFRQAKEHGDYLIVVVGRDDTVTSVKERSPLHDEKSRVKKIRSLELVDKAVLGNKTDKYKVIERYKPYIICLGYDQYFFTEKLKEELEKRKLKVKIKRLKPHKPEIHKSSKLRALRSK